MIETLLGLGAAGVLHGELDRTAWRAYEMVEECWIRERHTLLVKQTPAACNAAEIDLALKMAELQRRGMQFNYLLQRKPALLRGGLWQLSWLPLSDLENQELQTRNRSYKRQGEHIRALSEVLRSHQDYPMLRQAQTRLWKTPEYKEIHRRYTGRMQDLHRLYDGVS